MEDLNSTVTNLNTLKEELRGARHFNLEMFQSLLELMEDYELSVEDVSLIVVSYFI